MCDPDPRRDAAPRARLAVLDEVVFGCANQAGEINLAIAGGVESMSRAPFVMHKAGAVCSRSTELHDTTIGWRFVNPLMKAQYGVVFMPETAENVAEGFGISRVDRSRVELPFNPDSQAFSAVFIQDVDRLEGPAVVCSMMHEVVHPNMMAILRAQSDT